MFLRLMGLAIAAMLSLPTAVLAADPTRPAPPEGHYFYLAAVERDGQTIKLGGKLWIEGGQLGASVGCNTIGGPATFTGRRLTIDGSLTTTLMGCEAQLGAAESALVSALAAGPFAYDGAAFQGNGVRILATEAGTPPAAPPHAGGTGIEPEPGLDPEPCKALVSPEEWEAAFGSGFGASASDGVISSDGSTSVKPAAPPVAIDPAPGASAGTIEPSRPNAGPNTTPAGPANASNLAKPGAAATQPGSGPSEPAPIDLPAPGIGKKVPVVVKEGPAPTPSVEACREMLARIRTMVATAPNASLLKGDATASEAAAARDMVAGQASTASTTRSAVFVILLTLLAGLFFVGLRAGARHGSA